MKQKLSFFNWSLKKLLFSEPSLFSKAKIKILYTVLVFSIIKVIIVIIVSGYDQQLFQLGRAVLMLFLYILLLKLILYKNWYFIFISHFMIIVGLITIWSNIIFYAQTVNIVSFQFVFMIILSSFFILGTRFGILYSLLSTLPIIIYMFFGKELTSNYLVSSKLASPGYEIIGILNFITIIVAHYLFHQASSDNLKEKESLNAQLIVAVKDANQAAKSKSDFLSTMSHELRTPLNSVIGITNLFLDHPNSSDKIENLNILKFSAVSLHSLINDILDFNKLGSNKLNLEAIDVNIYELVNEICLGLRIQAEEKEVNLILDVDEQIKGKIITTDPTRITQIIYNLAGNAIKFTSKGSVKVRLDANNLEGNNITIKFSVIDTGIGINENMQVAIFEPFNQASSSITRDFGGTGLGLSIVKQLLQLFNSEINLKSVIGLGSTFSFVIPFKLATQQVVGYLENVEMENDLTKLKVLVAEDNLMNRLLLKKVLAKWKNEPVFAVNGKEAIEKFRTQAFDLILMDLHMPVMDGYAASKIIRGESDIHIIAFTASVSHNLDEKIKEAGMNDYIYKPFSIKDLYSKLNKISLKISQNSLNSKKR